jgi:hypothetical protein
MLCALLIPGGLHSHSQPRNLQPCFLIIHCFEKTRPLIMAAIPWLPSWIRNWNLFALGAMLPVMYLVFRWLLYAFENHRYSHSTPLMKHQRHPCAQQCRQRTLKYQRGFHMVLASLFVITGGLAVWLEVHYADWCPISAVSQPKRRLSIICH